MKVYLDIERVFFCLLFAIAFALTDVFAPEGGTGFNFIVLFVIGLLLATFIMIINKKLIDNQNREQNFNISNKKIFTISFCIYVIMGIFTQIDGAGAFP